MFKKNDTIRTDTEGIMFASLHKRGRSRIYRESLVFKAPVIKEDLLRKAVNSIVPECPYFCARVVNGPFWNRLQVCDTPPAVLPDNVLPARTHNIAEETGGPDFCVYYTENSIALEISHVLTDGSSLFKILCALAQRYFDMLENDGRYAPSEVLTAKDAGTDPFEIYYTGTHKANKDVPDTFNFADKPENDYLKVTDLFLDVDEVKVAAKNFDVSVTEFLARVIIYSIIRHSASPITNTISISVPGNIRTVLPSGSLRNFTADYHITFDPRGRSDTGLEEIFSVVRGQVKKQAEKEALLGFIDSTYAITLNPVIRAVPLFVKKPVLRLAQKISHRKMMTTGLSNLGRVCVPGTLADKVDCVTFSGGSMADYGIPVFCTAVSYNGRLHMSVNICSRGCDFDDRLIGSLRQCGIELEQKKQEGTF